MRPARLGLTAGAALAAALALAPHADASGISVARFGGEHGHPTTNNATAIYYNPAGIAMSDGTHVFLDVNLAWRKVTYERETAPSDCVGASCPSVPGANDGKGSLFNILASPMVGVTTKLGDVGLGAAFYTPFGGQSIWDKNDDFKDDPTYAGPYDGVQRWYVMEGTIRSSFISLAGAYHLKPARLAFGLSGNLILSTVDTVRAKTSGGDADLRAEGRAYLHTTGVDWSLGAGVMYEAIEKQLWVGASYQSRPNLTGMKPLKGEQTTFLPGGGESTVDAEIEHEIPDVYRLGFRYRPAEDLELRVFGDYQRWSVLEKHIVTNTENGDLLLDQRREWKDTFGVRVGGSKWLNKSVEAFAGAGYSSNAVPKETLEPALPDWDGFSFTAGGRFELVDKLFLAASYTQLVYLPRKVSADESELDQGTGLAHLPDGNGNYKQMVGVLNVNVDFQF